MAFITKMNIIFSLILIIIICIASGEFVRSNQEGFWRFFPFWRHKIFGNSNTIYTPLTAIDSQPNTPGIYYIETLQGGTTVNQLPNIDIRPGSNTILAFTIDYNGQTSGNWTQIIGVTGRPDGSDHRYLAVWFCPNSTTLHIRTATVGNSNNNISDCQYALSPGTHSITIIGNSDPNSGNQTYTVYDRIGGSVNIVAQNVSLSPQADENGKNYFKYNDKRVYIYSSFGYDHTSKQGNRVYEVVLVTSKNKYTLTDADNILSDLKANITN